MIEPKNLGKRSSLKNSLNLTSQELVALQQKHKRNSVNWASALGGCNFNFREIKTSFEKIEEEKEPSKKVQMPGQPNKFDNARRESIKNEFAAVKKYLKENLESLETEEEDEDEVKQNTLKNKDVGRKNSGSDSENSDVEDS